MVKRNKFPFYRQKGKYDCGATCLQIICEHYGKIYTSEHLKKKGNIETEESLSLEILSNAAEKLGFNTFAAKLKFDNLKKLPVPFIAHWYQDHFIVVYKVEQDKIYVADPSRSLGTCPNDEFKRRWVSMDDDHGVVLSLETSASFYEEDITT